MERKFEIQIGFSLESGFAWCGAVQAVKSVYKLDNIPAIFFK